MTCVFLGDRLGRRKTIFLAGCIALVGIIIQASPFSLGQLIAGRVITGTYKPSSRWFKKKKEEKKGKKSIENTDRFDL